MKALWAFMVAVCWADYSDIGSAESACIGSLLAAIPASKSLSIASEYYSDIISLTARYKENAKKSKNSCLLGDRFWHFLALYMEGYTIPL